MESAKNEMIVQWTKHIIVEKHKNNVDSNVLVRNKRKMHWLLGLPDLITYIRFIRFLIGCTCSLLIVELK